MFLLIVMQCLFTLMQRMDFRVSNLLHYEIGYVLFCVVAAMFCNCT